MGGLPSSRECDLSSSSEPEGDGVRGEDTLVHRVSVAVMQIALVVIVGFLAHRDQQNECEGPTEECRKGDIRSTWSDDSTEE